MTGKRLLLLTLSFFLSYFVTIRALKGSCEASKKCCNGKDQGCLVALNSLSESLSQIVEPCYCDHGCLELGDCCPDFKDYCGIMDCRVSEWKEWSKCDVSCGIGNSLRKRFIIHPESNGGIPCPKLKESKTCNSTNCGHSTDWDKMSALKETAMILPGKYMKQQSRQGRLYDVRANLRSYKKIEEEENPYCVVFHVEKTSKACHLSSENSALSKGASVCVRCEKQAKRESLAHRCSGHGVQGELTRFKSVLTAQCHGKWKRVEIVEGNCPCRSTLPDFIFV